MIGRALSRPFPSPYVRTNNREVSLAGDLPATPDPRLAMRWAVAALATVSIPVVLLTVAPHLGPGIRYADVAALCICLAAFAVAALGVSWLRFEQYWLLLLIAVPVVFVAALNSLAGAGQSPYFVMYAPILAIAGWYLSVRQTGLVIAFVIGTELWRAIALDLSGSIDHLAIALPFVIVIAATASLSSHWLRRALAETRRDQIRMSSTLDAVRQLGNDPVVGVLAQLERSAGRVFDANATAIRIGARRLSTMELTAALTDDHNATVLVPGARQLHALLRLEAHSGLSANDVRLAAILAEAAGRTLDAQGMLLQSDSDLERDSLTGLLNRRSLERDLATAVELDASGATPDVGLLFVDIDGFRALNDRHGHTAGDAVLAHLAEALKASLRPVDAAYRFGGDEFAVVLRGGGRAFAEVVAERIRDRAATAAWREDDPDVPRFRISVGLALLGPNASAADLLAAADDQMAEAKRARRKAPLAGKSTPAPPLDAPA